jgi:uncharacterized protein (TIGR02246 family)
MNLLLSVTCLTAAILFPAAGTSRQQQDPSTAVVDAAKRQSAAYVQSFNDRKLEDLVSLFTADGDFAFLQGPSFERLDYGEVRGRDRMANCVQAFFELFPDSRLRQTVIQARLIRPDVMIVDLSFEITGFPRDAGPIRGRSVLVWVKDNDAWKIAAERNVSQSPAPKKEATVVGEPS